MTRWILLAAALAAINPLTDFAVDYAFTKVHSEPVGYTASDISGMKKLLDKTLAKRKHKMTEAEQAAAMIYLWGDAR